MRLIKYFALPAIIGLTACQGGESPPKADTSKVEAGLTLRATSDIQTPSPIKSASFVPNSVASWLGHIILLDAKGTLHRATTGSAKTEVVALGKYADVIGLSRHKKAGVFLALTPQGQIKAFVETDDEGNFGPLAVSMDGTSFQRFCASSTPSQDFIWARTTSETTQKLAVEIFEDTSITLTQAEIYEDDVDPCSANNALSLTADYTVKPSTTNTGLTLTSSTESLNVDITNGLSIGGMTDAGFVTVTQANMGSVFNEGLMLVADKNQGRLVLISRSYALKELEDR